MKKSMFSRFFVLLVLAVRSVCFAGEDPRDVRNGNIIPDENYCDQPYVVVTQDGNWLCTMTTGPGTESQRFQHVVATISADHGKTWCKPIDIEPGESPDWRMSSWAVPLVTPGGRVYAFYNYDGDKVRQMPNGKKVRECVLGWYCYRYSDDHGRTWSKRRYRLPLRVTAADLNNNWQGKVQMFWGIDKPIIINRGKSAFFAFTKLGQYILDNGEGWFFRSDNILTEPDVEKIKWKMLPDGEYGVRNPAFGSIQEEHNVVELNNGNLYCVYRTTMGVLGLSLSKNGGHSWSMPAPMQYRPQGRVIKNNRACPMLWKTSDGKYLFWFHNNGMKSWKGRNPVWITGGTEKQGVIHWSEPEILLYDKNPTVLGMSYPDLIKQDGRYWVAETQKSIARVHEIDKGLLEGLWNQESNKRRACDGLLLEWRPGEASSTPVLPRAIDLTRSGGITLDCWIQLDNLGASQVLLAGQGADGKGVSLIIVPGGAVRLQLSDGTTTAAWDCDPGLLQAGKLHHIVAIADTGPQIITFVLDGVLCDGGQSRIQGWGRWQGILGTVLDTGELTVDPALKSLCIYDRYLRTSEAIGNFQYGIGIPTPEPTSWTMPALAAHPRGNSEEAQRTPPPLVATKGGR